MGSELSRCSCLSATARLFQPKRTATTTTTAAQQMTMITMGVARRFFFPPCDDCAQRPVPSSQTFVTGPPFLHVMQSESPVGVGSGLKPQVAQVSWHLQWMGRPGVSQKACLLHSHSKHPAQSFEVQAHFSRHGAL